MPELGQLSTEQKTAALDTVLRSRGLSRSDQLKGLLTYLVQNEISGASVTEYQIAVDGLGLPASYNPGEDSTVRNRAYTLRKKLDEIYRTELADAPLRIEFPKGTYVPRFVEAPVQPLAPPLEREAVQEVLLPVVAAPAPPAPRIWQWVAAAFLAGVLVAGMALWAWTARSPIPAVIREAWGPLLEPDANALICVATTPQMPVRPLPGTWRPLKGEPTMEAPPAIDEWYRRLRPVPDHHKLFLLPTMNSVGLGDALGASSAARLLATAGAPFQVMAERVVPLAAMRKRNVVLLGGSSDTETIRHWLGKAPFRVLFNNTTGDYSLMETNGARRIFAARRSADNQLVETYGLVTVMPSEGSEGQQRTITVVGAYTAGIQGAMDFITSAQSLEGFRKQLGGRFPKAYQVVVKTSMDQMLPLSYAYATHVVMEP